MKQMWVENYPPATVVHLGPAYGSVDEQGLRNVERILHRCAQTADPPNLLLDFSNTKYFGCGFLSVMLRCYERVKQRDGRFILCGLSPNPREVLHATQLDRLWEIYTTHDEAERAIRRCG